MSLFGAVWEEEPLEGSLKHLKYRENLCFRDQIFCKRAPVVPDVRILLPRELENLKQKKFQFSFLRMENFFIHCIGRNC